MVYNPNANWTAAIAEPAQVPVYYVAIDGLTTKHYSTGPVLSPAVTKLAIMNPPRGGGGSIDLIEGRSDVGGFTLELLDLDGEISDLLAVEAPGAPVASIKNRKVTLYGGYAELAESDYAAIGVYRIAGVKANSTLTGFVFDLVEPTYLIDGNIMTNATATKPSTIRGNVVNLAMSIMRGVFSTSDADFPLDFVSVDSGSSSVPTGLGIADAVFDFTQIKAERDTWRYDDVGEIVFVEPEDGRAHLEAEFFRNLQARPFVTGPGLLGIKMNTPALPASAAPALVLDDTVRVVRWTQLLDEHLNKFVIRGDYDEVGETYDTALYDTETAEDTANQSATGETIEYIAESRWLHTAYNGVEIAEELAGRLRVTYLGMPALVKVQLLFSKRNLEAGDVVALTHPDVPDLRTGTRGVTGRLMTIVSIGANFAQGKLELELLDLGFRRYGVIAPDAQVDFGSATDQEKSTFFFISDSSAQMGDGSDGYRFI
jgi:hypothetical protein